MLIRAEKLAALALDKRAPGGVRLFRRVKRAEMDFFVINRRASNEFSAARGSPHTARQITYRQFAVPKVLLLGRFAKVFPAVIQTVAVEMINALGPRSRPHCPDDAVHQNVASANADKEVVPSSAASGVSSIFIVPCRLVVLLFKMMQRARLPHQASRLGIIRKALVQVSL